MQPCRKLTSRGLRVVRQQDVPVVYRGTQIEMGFRADLVVEDKVIVEIKSNRNCSGRAQETVIDLLAPGGQAPGPAYQLQRRTHQRRHHTHSQRHAKLI